MQVSGYISWLKMKFCTYSTTGYSHLVNTFRKYPITCGCLHSSSPSLRLWLQFLFSICESWICPRSFSGFSWIYGSASCCICCFCFCWYCCCSWCCCCSCQLFVAVGHTAVGVGRWRLANTKPVSPDTRLINEQKWKHILHLAAQTWLLHNLSRMFEGLHSKCELALWHCYARGAEFI